MSAFVAETSALVTETSALVNKRGFPRRVEPVGLVYLWPETN